MPVNASTTRRTIAENVMLVGSVVLSMTGLFLFLLDPAPRTSPSLYADDEQPMSGALAHTIAQHESF